MSKASDLANLIGNINMGGGGANKNVIINGAMNVAQRNVSATGLGGSDGYFTCDRWKLAFNTSGRITSAQDSSAPEGFANSLKLSTTTADTSIASGEYLFLQQRFEGQNLQAFAKGTSEAKPFAVSFYVKGNANATYVAELFDGDNSRQVSKTFNVTASWSRVKLSFPADTTGALDDDNATSMNLTIWLHAGSTYTSGTLNQTWNSNTNANRVVGTSSILDSTSRTFSITGVQLEVGQNPTSFEHEPFHTTFKKCTRYLQILQETDYANIATCHGTAGASSTRWYVPIILPYGELRANPTLSVSNVGHFRCTLQHSNSDTCSAITIGYNNKQTPNLQVIAGSSVQGVIRMFGFNANADARLTFDAEL